MKHFKYLPLLLIFAGFTLSAQQVRQNILFNDGWKFHKGDIADGDNPQLKDTGWRKVDLPHDWSIEGPFSEQWASATAYLPAGIGWYRKTFNISPGMRSKNIFLYFDGVYKNSEVWVNGHYVGKRPNGFIPFEYEISNYLNRSGTNIIAVKVDHTEFADSRWYTGSGIYRNVYLIATDPVHVDLWGIRFTTTIISDLKATANITVSTVNQSSAATPVVVNAFLFNQQGKVVANARQLVNINSKEKADASLSFTLSNPALWSTENPYLYKLYIALLVHGKKIDDVSEEVGFRSFNFDKNKGFSLNGKAMKLKGVCLHDDAGALGVAVPEEVWIHRLHKLKEAGCNAIRMSHNPHADYFYKLTDSMGFLVMDEAFDEWELGKNKWIKGWNVGKPGNDGYHTDFKEWAERDVKDMVMRNINRPSVIMWSIGNEIDYPNDPYTHEVLNKGRSPQMYGRGYLPEHPNAARLGELAKQLVAVVKRYDTTRPVTSALAGVVMSNETSYPEVLDIAGYNYQEFRYSDDHKRYPNRIIYGSENGHQLNAWDSVADNDYISGQFLWTGIDYMGEARSWPSKSNSAGLLDLAGFAKSAYYFRKSLWNDKPMIYLGTDIIKGNAGPKSTSPSWNYSPGDSVRISCFTNCDQAELFLNGTSLGIKKMANANDSRILTWQMAYQPGELMVNGFSKGRKLSDTIKTAGKPFAIKAVRDITTFQHNKKQLAQIEIIITDKNGNPVYNADNELNVSVDGPATLLGMESGDPLSHDDYKNSKRKAYHGKLLAYIQAKKKQGAVKVRISSQGLQAYIVVFK